MPSGLTFDLVLISAIVLVAIWEAVIAIRTGEKKRFLVVALALIAAGTLFYLRSPQLLTHP